MIQSIDRNLLWQEPRQTPGSCLKTLETPPSALDDRDYCGVHKGEAGVFRRASSRVHSCETLRETARHCEKLRCRPDAADLLLFQESARRATTLKYWRCYMLLSERHTRRSRTAGGGWPLGVPGLFAVSIWRFYVLPHHASNIGVLKRGIGAISPRSIQAHGRHKVRDKETTTGMWTATKNAIISAFLRTLPSFRYAAGLIEK